MQLNSVTLRERRGSSENQVTGIFVSKEDEIASGENYVKMCLIRRIAHLIILV
jgi:hypothetical protein